MKLKVWKTMMNANIKQAFSYNASTFVFIFINNLFYIALVYFLWKGIFISNNVKELNGMNFSQIIFYTTSVGALQPVIETYIIWQIYTDIISGQISLHLMKPMNYSSYLFFLIIGENVINLLIISLPSFVIIYFLTKGIFVIKYNIFLFLVSLVISVINNYLISFIIGVFCIYLQSPLGLDNMRMIIIYLLSGAIIPLPLFPQTFRKIIMILPFQTIYDRPMQLLLKNTFNFYECLLMIMNQVFWTIILSLMSKFIWLLIKRKITVNGG